jgi:hypothetical protein
MPGLLVLIVSQQRFQLYHDSKTNGRGEETAEQKSAKLARNVHWMVLYQICVFSADLKSNMAAHIDE